MRKKKTEIPMELKTANEFVNVKDIRDIFLYSKDEYLFAYLRIYSFNLDLLSREERYTKTQALTALFDGDRKNFDYFSFPREIDLDNYKNALKRKYQEELNDLGRRRILMIMMKTAQELSTSGENYEHQHFIKIWKKIEHNHDAEARHDLRVRIEEFKTRYASVGIESQILSEQEIIKLCNLFGNSRQVSYEVIDSNLIYTKIPQIHA